MAPAAFAANSSVPNMTAATSVAGTDLWYCAQSAGTLDRKCTSAQFAAYVNSLFSQDCTVNGTGTVTCLKTNNVAFTSLATTAPGTGVATALGVNVGTAGSIVVNGGALGTPSSGTLTNATGLPIAGTTGWGTGVASALAAALNSSTGLIGALTPTNNNCVVGNGSAWASTACPSGATFANPTATAGPTANNGVATTAMRSDASPAIQLGSASQKGIVQVDGTTITATGGVISATTGGGGTVTSVAAGCGTSTGGSAITTSGTVSAAITKRANTTTSDTIVAADCGNVVTESNASAIAVAIAQAGTTGFAAGAYFEVCNIGAGTATITPTTSTIGGASTLAIPGGSAAAPVCYSFQSDGTNYNLIDGPTVNASLLTGGTVAAARGGAGTINGALKGNGSGTVSQAACADLSNGATGCSTATGTSGATLPLLNGTNTWSGTQTFGTTVGTVTSQSGTTYTFASTDCGTTVRFTNAAAVTATIPQGLPVGCSFAVEQTTSAGQVSVNGSAVTPATLHSAHSYTKTFGQWAIIGVFIESTNVAIVTGDGA